MPLLEYEDPQSTLPRLPPGAVSEDNLPPLPPGATFEPTPTNPNPPPQIGPDPAGVAAFDRAQGVPLYQFAPDKPPAKELPPPGKYTDPRAKLLGQVGSGLSTSAAGLDHIIANIAGFLDSGSYAPTVTGIPRLDIFKGIEDWARDRQRQLQDQATEMSGGEQSLAGKIIRGGVSSVASLPVMALATGVAGPVGGMAAMGALETADQGAGNMVKGAVEGGLMGKFIHVVGPAGRMIRVPLVMGAEYVKNVAQGVDPETALANAMNMGGLSALGGKGKVPTRELPGYVRESLTPRLPESLQRKSQLNPTAQGAVDYLQEEGVPLTGFQLTGDRYLGAMEGSTAHTPLGAQRAREFHRSSQEAMADLSGELAKKVHPEPVTPYEAGKAASDELGKGIAELHGQETQAYKAAWEHAGDPAYTRRVVVKNEVQPLYDEAGEPTGQKRVPTYKEVNMPVDVRWMKEIAQEELPNYKFLPAAEQSQSAAYSIYKALMKMDDFITARQAEKMLQGFKAEVGYGTDPSLRNESQGAAARVIPRLQKSIDAAVAETGRDAVTGLQEGRRLHAEKMGIAESSKKLRDEPVEAFNQLSRQKDGGVEFLKQVAKNAPGSLPKIGRAYLDKLFEQATKEGGWLRADGIFRQWDSLGDQTKGMLFPNGQARALDRFFLASKITAERINTSGTALVKAAQDAGLNPFKWLQGKFAGDILFSPKGIKFLTGIAQNPPRSSAEMAKLRADAEKAFAKAKAPEEPPEKPPTPPEGTPAPSGGGKPAPAGLGQKIKEGVKKFWEDEEGTLTLRSLRKADRAAGSEQSTRVPTAVKATEDPLSNILTTGYKSWMRDPEMLRKNVNAMLDYPNFRDLQAQVKSGALSIPDAAEQIIGRVQENLQWLHDSMPANFRDRARLWYDGAHTIARKWSGDYGATPEQVAASMAVTSPGTDWFVNAERARRLLEFWQNRGSKAWDPRMAGAWRDKVGQAVKEKDVYRKIQGKSFNDVLTQNPHLAPIWFRVYDEAVNPREYRTLTPEGKTGDFARIGSGDPRQFSWSDFGQIKKALSILEDGSKENIHQHLGQEHKVRNFYNNIINPDSPREHTTIDTHAVAAGLIRPLSQMSTEVGHNFGGAGSSSSSVSGESGTYGLHKEAYRRVAAANGLLPREMQSITWEAIRSMFSPQFKRNPANVEYINSLWRDVSSGKITADAARKRALQFAGGFDQPTWFKGRWNPAIPKGGRNPGKSR